MKTTDSIYKANGITFYSYTDVVNYAKENDYRIINTTRRKFGNKIVHFVDLITIQDAGQVGLQIIIKTHFDPVIC